MEDGMNQTPQTAGEEWKAHWPLVISAMIGFSFYAMVTYSLTSVPGIKAVLFRFTSGDHAGPGTFRRRDFPARVL